MQEGANVAILELPMVISKAHAAARDALKEESNTLHVSCSQRVGESGRGGTE